MTSETTGDRWNHNVHYYPWILDQVRGGAARALDVGCGEGELVRRLSPVVGHVTGLDAADREIERARAAGTPPNATYLHGDLLGAPLPHGGFDLVTCVAALHHVGLDHGLRRLSELVAPGGTLAVVGLAANRTALDWIVSGAHLVVVRAVDVWRKPWSHGSPVADADHNLADVRRSAARLTPGATVRRRLYYRYTLLWTKPA